MSAGPIMPAELFVPPTLPMPERQLPLLKALHTMLDNPMEGWPRAIYEQPVYVPPRREFRTVYLCEPSALKQVLLDDVAHFPKSALSQQLLSPMLGRGLLTAEFGDWRWQRRAAAPVFQDKHVRAAMSNVCSIVARASTGWDARPNIDAAEAMMGLTFEIILETMLGGAANVDAAEMGRQFSAYLRHLGRPSLADLLGFPENLRARFSPDRGHCIRYMHDAVSAMIARRRNAPPRGDLVDALLAARDHQTGRAMTDIELRDNLITFLAAGHETTALALTWALFLISRDQRTQHEVLAEADRAFDAGVDGAGLVDRLSFTRQVIQEAMRLYPPVPVLTRNAARACTLSGIDVRKGDIMVIPVYALHRHRLYWDQPDAFDPTRFAMQQNSGDRRFIYLPFGAGPRICIGAAFAMSEACLILAALVRQFHFNTPNQSVRPLLRITLRPEGGLPLIVKRRTPGGPHARKEHERVCA